MGPGGYFDSRTRLSPPLRQQRDREALRAALADGTIDALVSDHTPVDEDAKVLPFAEAEVGPPPWSCCRWPCNGRRPMAGMQRALATVTTARPAVLGNSLGCRPAPAAVEGGVADLCLLTPKPGGHPAQRAAAQPGQTHPVHRPG